MPTLVEFGPSNASQGQQGLSGYSIGTRKAGDQGSTPSECLIFNLFSCVLSSVLPLRSVGRSNFDKGRHNITTLIYKNRHLLTNC